MSGGAKARRSPVVVGPLGDLHGRYVRFGTVGGMRRRCDRCWRAAHADPVGKKGDPDRCDVIGYDDDKLSKWKPLTRRPGVEHDGAADGWRRTGGGVVIVVNPTVGQLVWPKGWQAWVDGELIASGPERGDHARASIDAWLTGEK